MLDEMDAAIEAARAAGLMLADRFGHARVVEHKGPIDIVTDADQSAERCIVAILSEATPDHGFLTEEAPPIRGVGNTRWIVDPLDGTVNFVRGIPHFGVSIALEREGQLELGVIFDPLRQELFAARRSMGATLNGAVIRVSAIDSLRQAVVSTGFPYDAWTNERDNTVEVAHLIKRVFSLRSSGSAALDLAAVACGRLDLDWERGLHPYDVAAGVLIVREAGGIATDYAGGDDAVYSRELVAGNARVHAAALAELEAAWQSHDGVQDQAGQMM